MRRSRAERQQMAVESWPIERVRPYEGNPRTCPASAIEKVATSIRTYGWRQPLVVDAAGVLIAGHTRLLAAKKLGLARVPVHVAADLSPAAVRAYRLADNRSGEETSWDPERLPSELAALLELDYDLSLLGFAEEELAAYLSEPTLGLTDPDSVPEAPAEPISRPGDLWLLGEHRLLCGDATKAEDVERLMAGKRATGMFTDPPYLVDYDGGNHPQTWKDGRKISGEAKTKHWDGYHDPATSVAFYAAFLTLACEHALVERPVLYQWFAMMRAPLIFAAWEQVGLLPHQVIIWHKSRRVLSHSDFMWDYEPALYGWIAGRRPVSSRRPPANATTLWEISSMIEDGAGSVHPTMKPVELIRRAIEYHTKPSEIIYEPFSGSGTAIIAAEMSGRACYAMELSPAFVDVALTRWANFTGKEVVRDGQE